MRKIDLSRRVEAYRPIIQLPTAEPIADTRSPRAKGFNK